jgi:four helix bundle protein
VRQDAIEFYKQTYSVFRHYPFEVKKVDSQAIASSDSVHRNVPEGYCRRSVHEYIKFLCIALGSLGESVSGLHAYRVAGQINEEEFQKLDNIAYKLENGLLKLIESIEHKRDQGEWIDCLNVKETNALYGLEFQYSSVRIYCYEQTCK